MPRGRGQEARYARCSRSTVLPGRSPIRRQRSITKPSIAECLRTLHWDPAYQTASAVIRPVLTPSGAANARPPAASFNQTGVDDANRPPVRGALRYRSGVNRGLQPLVATTLVGAGSVVTLALGIVAMKVYALLVGPPGVGVLALLQSVLNLALLAASAGLQASTITAVAAADAGDRRGSARSVARTAIFLSMVAGTAGAIALLLLSHPIAEFMLGTGQRSTDVFWLAPALLLSVTATVQAAVLAGMHRLKLATAAGVITAVGGTAVSIVIVGRLGIDGFASSLAATAVIQFAVAAYAVRRIGIRVLSPPLVPAWRTTRDLLALGLPVALSQAVTNGALFIIPVLVLHTLGSTEVGYYRAAAAISVGIGTFFLAGIHQDFLPRIASTDDWAERVALVERRMRLVIGIGLPSILGLLAMGPFILDLLYSHEFRPALAILQWQLIGDLARLPTVVLTFSALAIRSRVTYFGLEATSGLAIIGGTVVGINLLGLGGPGAGYAVAQLVTYAAAWFVVRRRLHTTPGRLQLAVAATAVGASLVLMTDPDPTVRLMVFGPAALIAAGISWPRLLRLHRASEL